MERAYVALLHGDRSEFLLYALLLGFRLRQFDAGCDRLLLLARKSYMSATDRACLDKFWRVKEVEAVDCPAADKTSYKRHRYVFSKLHVFGLPCKKVVFFDLDVVVLGSPLELFGVEAPAAMYHGRRRYRRNARHGALLPPEAFLCGGTLSGCINAGLMRIDPPATELERDVLVGSMIAAAASLDSRDQTYLPEQYFLARVVRGWRHIDVRWNCEVCPSYYVAYGGEVVQAESELPSDWLRLGSDQASLRARVCMFHFSGTWLEPWWFLHLRAEAGHDFVRHQLEHRDPRGLVALAVYEWLAGMEEMRESFMFTEQEKASIRAHTSHLARTANDWWEANDVCVLCGKLVYFGSVLGRCEECHIRSCASQTETGGRGGR